MVLRLFLQVPLLSCLKHLSAGNVHLWLQERCFKNVLYAVDCSFEICRFFNIQIESFTWNFYSVVIDWTDSWSARVSIFINFRKHLELEWFCFCTFQVFCSCLSRKRNAFGLFIALFTLTWLILVVSSCWYIFRIQQRS